jgi:hypothetical protein
MASSFDKIQATAYKVLESEETHEKPYHGEK